MFLAIFTHFCLPVNFKITLSCSLNNPQWNLVLTDLKLLLNPKWLHEHELFHTERGQVYPPKSSLFLRKSASFPPGR